MNNKIPMFSPRVRQNSDVESKTMVPGNEIIVLSTIGWLQKIQCFVTNLMFITLGPVSADYMEM